jgi:hypothetical protein
MCIFLRYLEIGHQWLAQILCYIGFKDHLEFVAIIEVYPFNRSEAAAVGEFAHTSKRFFQDSRVKYAA